MAFLVNHLLIYADKSHLLMTSGTFLLVHTCFLGLRGTQLGAIREWKKSLGSVQPAGPAVPFHSPNTLQTQSSVILGPNPKKWYVTGTIGTQSHPGRERLGSEAGSEARWTSPPP